MSDVAWNASCETGHDRIDSEHRILLGLIQGLAREVDTGSPQSRVLRLVAEIQKYAEYHFLREENVMIDIGFPGIAAHRIAHLRLLNELYRYTDLLRAGTTPPSEVAAFLANWFMAHTEREDQEITRYVAGHPR